MNSSRHVPSRDDIERAARAIAPHVRRTPIIEIDGAELGVDALLAIKLEYLQHAGSFKARGASHFVATQPIATSGIVAASGGNHGAAVAWAAQRFGHAAHIFVPTTATPAKVDKLRHFGATVHQVGEVYGDALAASREFLTEHDATSIHAYDDSIVMAGAGTCARELDLDAPDLDAVLVACGGGGLAGGAAAWYGTSTEIVAVETEGTATFAAARAAGEPVTIPVSGIAADALGATQTGDVPFQSLRSAEATSTVVGDDDVIAARTWLWDTLRILAEPAAATPIAALMSGRWQPAHPGDRLGVVICGANTTMSLDHGMTGSAR